MANFYIYNKAETDIEVSYSIAPNTYLLSPNPIILKLKNSNPSNTIKTVYAKNQNVVCTLQPNQALYLGNDINFFLQNETDQLNLNDALVELKITTNNSDELLHIDSNASSYFTQVNRHTIALIIK